MGINIWSVQVNSTLKWMTEGFLDGKSTSVEVMVWCPQATIHYLNQGWPRSLTLCIPIRLYSIRDHKELNSCFNNILWSMKIYLHVFTDIQHMHGWNIFKIILLWYEIIWLYLKHYFSVSCRANWNTRLWVKSLTVRIPSIFTPRRAVIGPPNRPMGMLVSTTSCCPPIWGQFSRIMSASRIRRRKWQPAKIAMVDTASPIRWTPSRILTGW